jgi:hypothetical protein
MAKASNENAGRGGIDDNHDLMHWRRFQNPVLKTGYVRFLNDARLSESDV